MFRGGCWIHDGSPKPWSKNVRELIPALKGIFFMFRDDFNGFHAQASLKGFSDGQNMLLGGRTFDLLGKLFQKPVAGI